MKIKTLLLAVATMVTLPSFAVKAVEDGSLLGTGQDSARCIDNLVSYKYQYDQKNYDSAYVHWKVVYDECPRANGRTLYQNGAYIIAYKLAKETDPAKKQAWFEDLMKCYDQRIKYFGNDKSYPEAYIIGRKAMDYIQYSPEKDLLGVALPWLEKSVKEGKLKAETHVIHKYFELLEVRYQSDKAKYAESFINSYLELGNMVDQRIAQGDKNKAAYVSLREALNGIFINSRAADCAILEGVFANKVEENKANAAELEKIINLFDKAKCDESEVYYAASRYAHALNPMAKTALGCARQYLKKEEYAKAVEFYNEALSLEQVDSLKYTYAIEKAGVLVASKRYAEAIASAREAIKYDSRQGEPYMLLAQIYVAVDPHPSDDVLNSTKYWAAVDKLLQAKSVEPGLAEKANTLINSYRKHYPNSNDVFMHNELKVGEAYTVGGVIGERVICREQ